MTIPLNPNPTNPPTPPHRKTMQRLAHNQSQPPRENQPRPLQPNSRHPPPAQKRNQNKKSPPPQGEG